MHKLKPKLAIQHPTNVAEDIATNGFAEIAGREFIMDVEIQQAFAALVDSFDDLPLDPNDPDQLRRRRYGRFVYIPWADALFEQPSVAGADGELVVEYFQPISLNSVDGGLKRPFIPLHPAIRSNRALHELIRFDYWSLPERADMEGMPITVGVHQVALQPKWGRPAIASPNHLHQDGEPFTFVHLARRQNITGGLNYVATADCAGQHPNKVDQSKILACFTLENLLDSFVVDDQRVSHHVDGVYPLFEDQTAERSAFLIDFTPNMPQIG